MVKRLSDIFIGTILLKIAHDITLKNSRQLYSMEVHPQTLILLSRWGKLVIYYNWGWIIETVSWNWL